MTVVICGRSFPKSDLLIGILELFRGFDWPADVRKTLHGKLDRKIPKIKTFIAVLVNSSELWATL